jgi:hypothetical protein
MLPLKKYHRIADLYGYILVCSYNSRNGPNEPIFKAANAMYTDVFDRFAADKRRVCLAGFSGGARISCLIAMNNPDIPSVIGCGAGFPFSQMPEESPTFDYCGIIGQQDMNFQELIRLDSALNRFPIQHMLITFPKGHQWPDSGSFHHAFYWLETNAMRNGYIPKDRNVLNSIVKDFILKIEKVSTTHRSNNKVCEPKNLLLLLSGLEEVPKLQDAYDSYIGTNNYLEEKLSVDSIRSFEVREHIKYLDEFEQISLLGIYQDHPVRNERWWESEFQKIDALNDTNLSARLKEFLVNGSWEQHYNSLRHNRYDVALGYLKVYKAGLPNSPSPPYLMAVAHATAGHRKEMYECLDEAIQKGLNDPEQLNGVPVFFPYKNQSKFIKLLTKIQ